MKPLVSCAFPPCWYVDVCRFVSKMTKQLLVLKRGKEGRKEQRFSVWVCVLTPPSYLNMDSSKPLGSTTWTDPQLRAKTVVFLQNKFLFAYNFKFFRSEQERKWQILFLRLLHLEFSFPAQTCWDLFRRFFQTVFFTSYSQYRVKFRYRDLSLCFNASVLVSHRFRWTNSDFYTS